VPDPKSYALWGSAGHAKVLADIVALDGGSIVALFDNDPNAIPVLPDVRLFLGADGFAEWIRGQQHPDLICGLAAIGGARGRDRLSVHGRFRSHGLRIEPIVHPTASVSRSALLGPGSQILALSVVAADTRLGEACIVNHRAVVDHECTLGDGVHLAPASTICGCVTLGQNVMVGAGAIVLPRISIGADTIVGAGAVVTHDLPCGVVAFGNPATVRRQREVEFRAAV